jgi:UDP:flavonoid glycosyltransferase YjiC (YdhE family)
VLRWLPREHADRYFEQALPFAFKHLARPVNALRKRHGLAPLGDLLDVLGFGDAVLYADVPELVPIERLEAHHHYLGPVLWSPPVPPPARFETFRDARPCVYVTMGSSGSLGPLEQLLRVLGALPVQVLLATAGRMAHDAAPDNVLAADYFDGAWAARQSDLVICNGGASTAYQALAEGTPVLGLPTNIDQWLAMTAIERTGAGVALRTRGLSDAALRDTIMQLLGDATHRDAAKAMASAFGRCDAGASFEQWLMHDGAVIATM